MPDVLWPFFRDNRQLAKALPSLAAKLIEAQISAKYGLRIGVMAILHTFNGKLEFNSHVHTMVTGGGLYGPDIWKEINYDRECDELMEEWRMAVVALLRAALHAGQLRTGLTTQQAEMLLANQTRRWWSVKVQSFDSKLRFLKYAGRYVSRPPMAQRRITYIGQKTVEFRYKDKKLGRKVEMELSLTDFIDRWSQHIPTRYQHAVRSFGLFAPRAISQTSAAIFAIRKQDRRPRPRPLSYAYSIKRDFGWDPLLDPAGKRMKWIGRRPPMSSR
jgi:hypothetical protein